jgi:SAM-dependent methyltransferase
MSTRGFTDAARYEDWFTSPLGAFVDALERPALQRAVADLTPGGRVVDIGAGTGHFARTLAGRHRIIAVEPGRAMVEEGRRRAAGLPVSWCTGVGERLPLADRSTDTAVLMTVLEWVDDPKRCVREVERVVRPGGRLIIGYLCALSPWAARYRRRADDGEAPWTDASFFTRSDIEDLVGSEPAGAEGVVHLAPDAVEPWPDADAAGRRAGNRPAVEVLRWNLTS